MKTFTLESNDGSVQIVITATDVAGGVKFDLAVTEGDADMIGFYLDWDGNGGSTFGINSGNGKGKDNGANNMNGADDNGDQITGFDYAYAIGEAGLGNGDTQTASVTVTAADLGLDAFTTADLTDAIVGVRATSTTSDDLGGREGSLKLTGTCDENGGDDCDAFPFISNLSNTVLYFDAFDNALTPYDVKPQDGGNPDPDGLFTFKVDGVESRITDLDDDLDTILAYIAEDLDGPGGISADALKALFLGAHYKAGNADPTFYASCDNNNNGVESDPFPTLDGKAVTDTDIDREVDYGFIFLA
jgi:hypothetical protein